MDDLERLSIAIFKRMNGLERLSIAIFKRMNGLERLSIAVFRRMNDLERLSIAIFKRMNGLERLSIAVFRRMNGLERLSIAVFKPMDEPRRRLPGMLQPPRRGDGLYDRNAKPRVRMRTQEAEPRIGARGLIEPREEVEQPESALLRPPIGHGRSRATGVQRADGTLRVGGDFVRLVEPPAG